MLYDLEYRDKMYLMYNENKLDWVKVSLKYLRTFLFRETVMRVGAANNGIYGILLFMEKSELLYFFRLGSGVIQIRYNYFKECEFIFEIKFLRIFYELIC